jgi:preprotein translocase subunit YajC
MDWLIQAAWAQNGASQENALLSLLPLIVLFIVFYFMLIRPQSIRMKEHKRMVDSLAKGDEIITNGGLLGKVTNLGENFVVVELAPNIEVKLQRHAIATVVPKGTLKTL